MTSQKPPFRIHNPNLSGRQVAQGSVGFQRMSTWNPESPSETTESNLNSSYTKWVPLLIGFFVGPLGFHRMWLGRFPSGIFMFALSGLAFYEFSLYPDLFQQVQRGETPASIPPGFLWATLILFCTTVWATVDCLRITISKFQDGAGLKITEWF